MRSIHEILSEVIWVSIEISVCTPLEKVDPLPPPPPWKMLDPSGSLEKYSFLCNKTNEPPL